MKETPTRLPWMPGSTQTLKVILHDKQGSFGAAAALSIQTERKLMSHVRTVPMMPSKCLLCPWQRLGSCPLADTTRSVCIHFGHVHCRLSNHLLRYLVYSLKLWQQHCHHAVIKKRRLQQDQQDCLLGAWSIRPVRLGWFEQGTAKVVCIMPAGDELQVWPWLSSCTLLAQCLQLMIAMKDSNQLTVLTRSTVECSSKSQPRHGCCNDRCFGSMLMRCH